MSILVNPKTIRALAFDLDGTLLAPGAILSERTLRAVKRCVGQGIQIILATGRGMESAEPFRAALNAEGPMVYFNGATVVDMPGAKFLNTTLLDTKVAEFCVELSREMGVYCQIYFPPGNSTHGGFPNGNKENLVMLLSEQDSPEREMYYEHTRIQAELGDLKEALSRPGLSGCVKAMFLAEPEILVELRKRLDERLGNSVYIAKTQRTFLEILDAKVSKGQGLKFVMERCSLKSKEVIAFGDEESDLPMFNIAGFSAAPSNALDSVKAQVNLVIGSCAENGVASFLEDLFGV
jgi:Cof subfamily protein (haloacid dehalogenase superfamily)